MKHTAFRLLRKLEMLFIILKDTIQGNCIEKCSTQSYGSTVRTNYDRQAADDLTVGLVLDRKESLRSCVLLLAVASPVSTAIIL